MRKLPFILLTIAATANVILGQKEFKPIPQKTKQTVMDFRVTRNSPPPKIPVATQRAILGKVFKRFLNDAAKCNSQFEGNGTDDPLKAARNAGQIVPTINDMVTGSFTAPGQTQTAYVISVSECNASHADNYGTKRIAVFSGPQLVADLDVDFKDYVLLKMDLNSDGVDELLMTGGDMNQGIETEVAALVDLQSGKLKVIQDFGIVSEDSCASEMPGSTSKAALLSIMDLVPGTMPKIKMDNYVSSCRGPKRWKFLSSGKMPD
jgi:hypothetical protein